MTNEQVIEKAKEEITLRGLSEATAEEYLKSLRVFMRYYEGRQLEEMSEIEIRDFLLYLLNEKHSTAGTVNIYNSALRFIFGAVLGRTLNYQMIPRRRIHRDLPIIMSKSELVKFFDSIDNLRDKAIFMTIYGGGLRLSEITSLRIQDIDSENMRIFVHHGKGGKDRYTLLSNDNLNLLRAYWKAYRPNHPEGYLFYPKGNKSRRIGNRAVQDAMAKHLKESNLSSKFAVHTIRHCFATHLLESGVDVCRIKQLMGHTHIQSTTFYLHLLNFDETIKSPLDMLPKKCGRKPKEKAEVAING
jgi:integrase/recombinase XerD